MIFAAILAGGKGKRIERSDMPKQFLSIGGTPILIMTLRVFLDNKQFEKIYIAVHKDWIEYTECLLDSYLGDKYIQRICIVEGGKERLDSFANVMEAIISKYGVNCEDILVCHDSVRPFVRQQMIEDCIKATIEKKCALTVVPVTDTIHVAHEDNLIDGTLERKNLYNGQTPSGFQIELLKNTLDALNDEDKKNSTGTTQLILKAGHSIAMVTGHTSNMKITTDNDLDVAERIVRGTVEKKEVSLLDCTLRDGGIVIGFEFGKTRMQEIKRCIEDSGVEYLECGYIDENKGKDSGCSCYKNERVIEKEFLSSGKKINVNYLAMVDFGKYDISKLSIRTKEGIDGIRLAFHKEQWRAAIESGKEIIEKGYDLYIQPMVSMRYSDEEFIELIKACNKELTNAKAFYIVDSFGQMDPLTARHYVEVADRYVIDSMKIGFHAHNNRQMAFSDACEILEQPLRHALMLDSSIMGMGKGAGNLCSELIIPEVEKCGYSYNLIGMYELISDYFTDVMRNTPWGYNLDYYLASIYGCTPSYIKIFTKDVRVTTDVLIQLLMHMPDEKKIACDEIFANEYIKDFLQRGIYENKSIFHI